MCSRGHRRLALAELPDDPAAIENQDAVTDIDQLVQLVGDDRRPPRRVSSARRRCAGFRLWPGHRRLASARRAAARAARSPPAWRPPPSAGCRRSGTRQAGVWLGVLMPRARMNRSTRRSRAASDETEAVPQPIEHRKTDIVPHAGDADDAQTMPVARQIGETLGQRGSRLPGGIGFPVERHAARRPAARARRDREPARRCPTLRGRSGRRPRPHARSGRYPRYAPGRLSPSMRSTGAPTWSRAGRRNRSTSLPLIRRTSSRLGQSGRRE